MKFTRLSKSLVQGLLSLVLMGLSASNALATDPSMSEVYKAAESGNFAQANAMMKQVLSDHPNSGKAHFVNAELMAKEGRIEAARDELQIAEKLAPGLPGIKPEAVSGLKARLSAPPPAVAQNNNYAPVAQHSSSNSSSILPWVIGFAVVAFIFFVYRMFARPQQVYMPQPQYGNMGPTPMGGVAPMGQPYGPAPMGGGGGMGSGIMGGLVTGAAVGAGMVAGEALMHNVLGDHGNSNSGGFAPNNSNNLQGNAYPSQGSGNYDMGGNNFGVQDSGSWDDSSSGGGGSDDW